MRRNTVVTNTYVVDIMNKDALLDGAVAVTDEVLIEAEDDIVTAAVFIYHMNESFGDTATFGVQVGFDGADNTYVVVDNGEDLSYLDKIGDKYHGTVLVTMRAATGRL